MSKTIHVLRQGSPLCRFSGKVPRDWPQKHVWVGFNDVSLKALSKNPWRCEPCFAIAVDAATEIQTHQLDGFAVEWHDDYPDIWIMTCDECRHIGIWDREADKEYDCSGCGAGPISVDTAKA